MDTPGEAYFTADEAWDKYGDISDELERLEKKLDDPSSELGTVPAECDALMAATLDLAGKISRQQRRLWMDLVGGQVYRQAFASMEERINELIGPAPDRDGAGAGSGSSNRLPPPDRVGTPLEYLRDWARLCQLDRGLKAHMTEHATEALAKVDDAVKLMIKDIADTVKEAKDEMDKRQTPGRTPDWTTTGAGYHFSHTVVDGGVAPVSGIETVLGDGTGNPAQRYALPTRQQIQDFAKSAGELVVQGRFAAPVSATTSSAELDLKLEILKLGPEDGDGRDGPAAARRAELVRQLGALVAETRDRQSALEFVRSGAAYRDAVGESLTPPGGGPGGLLSIGHLARLRDQMMMDYEVELEKGADGDGGSVVSESMSGATDDSE